MQFKDIPGKQEIKDLLLKSLRENRVSHAQLFLGPEGSGSLALAIAYAQYISCEKPGSTDSCGECPSCIKYQKLIHPDLHFSYPFIAKDKESKASDFIVEWREFFLSNPYPGIENWLEFLGAENKQGNINIYECHSIISKLSLKSFEGGYKVLIMWLPEYLKEVGNTLLKLIEEPSPGTLIIFVAENREQILNTILSRMQLIKIDKFSDKEIELYLQDVLESSPEQASGVAYLSDGNMNTALHILNNDENDDEKYFAEWMRICYANDGNHLMNWIDQISEIGRENQKKFLRYGMEVIRDCILLNADAAEMIRYRGKELDLIKFSKVLKIENGNLIFRELQDATYHIERNANPRILFLDLSIKIIKLLKNTEINLLAI